MIDHLYRHKPCSNCPFRTDCLKGWLGAERIKEIIDSESFVCHKNTDLQCAGHMLLNDDHNEFVSLARRLSINLKLHGKELIFDNKEDCIKHHESIRTRQKS